MVGARNKLLTLLRVVAPDKRDKIIAVVVHWRKYALLVVAIGFTIKQVVQFLL